MNHRDRRLAKQRNEKRRSEQRKRAVAVDEQARVKRTASQERCEMEGVELALILLECSDMVLDCDNVVELTEDATQRIFGQRPLPPDLFLNGHPREEWGFLAGGGFRDERAISRVRVVPSERARRLYTLWGKQPRYPLVKVEEIVANLKTGAATVREVNYYRHCREGRQAGSWEPLAAQAVSPHSGLSGALRISGRTTLSGGEMHTHEQSGCVGLAVAMEFCARTLWSVKVAACGGRCRLRYFTDATGAAHFFRLRDLPADAARRPALLHWVRQHARRALEPEPTTVVGHLRGRETFTWAGLQCEVLPPADRVPAALV